MYQEELGDVPECQQWGFVSSVPRGTTSSSTCAVDIGGESEPDHDDYEHNQQQQQAVHDPWARIKHHHYNNSPALMIMNLPHRLDDRMVVEILKPLYTADVTGWDFVDPRKNGTKKVARYAFIVCQNEDIRDEIFRVYQGLTAKERMVTRRYRLDCQSKASFDRSCNGASSLRMRGYLSWDFAQDETVLTEYSYGYEEFCFGKWNLVHTDPMKKSLVFTSCTTFHVCVKASKYCSGTYPAAAQKQQQRASCTTSEQNCEDVPVVQAVQQVVNVVPTNVVPHLPPPPPAILLGCGVLTMPTADWSCRTPSKTTSSSTSTTTASSTTPTPTPVTTRRLLPTC